LLVTETAAAMHAALGARASHLTRIGDEGFIDRRRIERVGQFDADKALAPGQQRYAVAVNFKGVYRQQYFKATEAELRGAPVIDIMAGASRPATPAIDLSKRSGKPEVR